MKTADLIGPALDWAVATLEGEAESAVIRGYVTGKGRHTGRFAPSIDWSQGGPIIEREFIELHVLPSCFDPEAHAPWTEGDVWEANLWLPDQDIIQFCGPTPLIAAMRCYIASKLGDDIEIPEELK